MARQRRQPKQTSLDLFHMAPYLGEGERWAKDRGYERAAGVDEVGRGPLAGPVVAAAVHLPDDLSERLLSLGLDDSKRLTPARREALASLVLSNAHVGLAEVDAARIDEVNILRASFEAMAEAITRLCAFMSGSAPDLLLVDGNARITPHPLPSVRQHAMVQGDGRAICIAAASVVAKVHRDSLMVRYDEQFPGYGLAGHKGYPCKEHILALGRLGPSPIHRLSFRGVLRAEPSKETGS